MTVRSQLLLLCLLAGCFRAPDEDRATNSPLLHSPDAAGVFDVEEAATNPDLLRKVVLASHRTTTAKLGAHWFRGTHTMRVTEDGKIVESLDETSTLELSKTGAFHLQYENSRDYGRETYFDGKTVWVRPRYGKYHRRPPASRDEPTTLTNDIYATLAADYELVAHAVDIQDLGTTKVGNRQARKIKLSLGKARKRPPQRLLHKSWRGQFVVTYVAGELLLDKKTGALLAGKLTSKGQLVRAGRTFELALVSTHRLTQGPVTLQFPTVEDSVETPKRSTDVADREKLLKGIAPPMPRGHTPVTKQAKKE